MSFGEGMIETEQLEPPWRIQWYNPMKLESVRPNCMKSADWFGYPLGMEIVE